MKKTKLFATLATMALTVAAASMTSLAANSNCNQTYTYSTGYYYPSATSYYTSSNNANCPQNNSYSATSAADLQKQLLSRLSNSGYNSDELLRALGLATGATSSNAASTKTPACNQPSCTDDDCDGVNCEQNYCSNGSCTTYYGQDCANKTTYKSSTARTSAKTAPRNVRTYTYYYGY